MFRRVRVSRLQAECYLGTQNIGPICVVERVWRTFFKDCERFNEDISRWNVSNVTNMDEMFYGADVFNGDISRWDVSKVRA